METPGVVASLQRLFGTLDEESSKGVVDPRVTLEPGKTLPEMLLRADVPDDILSGLIQIAIIFEIAEKPEGDIADLLAILIAGHTGRQGRARRDYLQALLNMATSPRDAENEAQR